MCMLSEILFMTATCSSIHLLDYNGKTVTFNGSLSTLTADVEASPLTIEEIHGGGGRVYIHVNSTQVFSVDRNNGDLIRQSKYTGKNQQFFISTIDDEWSIISYDTNGAEKCLESFGNYIGSRTCNRNTEQLFKIVKDSEMLEMEDDITEGFLLKQEKGYIRKGFQTIAYTAFEPDAQEFIVDQRGIRKKENSMYIVATDFVNNLQYNELNERNSSFKIVWETPNRIKMTIAGYCAMLKNNILSIDECQNNNEAQVFEVIKANRNETDIKDSVFDKKQDDWNNYLRHNNTKPVNTDENSNKNNSKPRSIVRSTVKKNNSWHRRDQSWQDCKKSFE